LRDRRQSYGVKRKDELVALAFAVSSQNLPLVPSKDELKQQTDLDYDIVVV
jgi:hypothetical protein